MALRFKTFRHALTGEHHLILSKKDSLKSDALEGFTIVLSCVSIGLGLSLMKAFSHPRIGWMVVSIQTVTILRALFSYALRNGYDEF